MEINGIKVTKSAVDWSGARVGELTVQKLVGRNAKRRTLLWECLCDCGNSIVVTSAELKAEDTKSCGCLKTKKTKERKTIHGFSGTREHKAWKRIKQRCCNPNSTDYEFYSKIGMEEDLKRDFREFYAEIGEIPSDFLGRVSVDRIDNSLGYIGGNIRWANDEQQARNKGMYENNSSGVNGVYLHTGKTGYQAWASTWYEGSNNQKTKYFGVNKYGDELAFFLACEYRDLMIQRLNLAGAGYTENHGKEKTKG